MKTTIDFIIFSIFYIFIKIFNFLSPKIRLKISEFIGVLLFYLIPKGRKLSYRNLNLILNEQNNFNYSKKKIKEIRCIKKGSILVMSLQVGSVTS